MPTYLASFFQDEIETEPYHLSRSEVDLFDKIGSEDVKGVRKCLTDKRTREKINLNCFNEKGLTPLSFAITKGINDDVKRMIRILLKYGAQINLQNGAGQTVLHHACAYRADNTADVINVLLQNDANPNLSEASSGYTPLHVACINENHEVAKYLLLYKADVNCVDDYGCTPLMQASGACIMDGMELISLLLENNALVNLQNDRGKTALHLACVVKNVTTVEILLRRGNAYVDCHDCHGDTPLIIASQASLMDGEEIISLLLEKNASVNLRNDREDTALHIACYSQNDTTVEMLLRSGADPNVKNIVGATPLHLACQWPCHENVQMLLEYNADAECQDNDGNTPLHSAVDDSVGERNVDIVRADIILALSKCNTNVYIQNIYGETPLLRAVHFWAPFDDFAPFVVVKLLLMFGSDVNVQRLRRNRTFGSFRQAVIGDAPLHVAIRYNNEFLVRMILDHNPDMQMLNINKQTARDLAKELGCNEIVTRIEEHMYKIRCQMYTFYHETWCHHLSGSSPSTMKSISPVKKRRRKRKTIFMMKKKGKPSIKNTK